MISMFRKNKNEKPPQDWKTGWMNGLTQGIHNGKASQRAKHYETYLSNTYQEIASQWVLMRLIQAFSFKNPPMREASSLPSGFEAKQSNFMKGKSKNDLQDQQLTTFESMQSAYVQLIFFLSLPRILRAVVSWVLGLKESKDYKLKGVPNSVFTQMAMVGDKAGVERVLARAELSPSIANDLFYGAVIGEQAAVLETLLGNEHAVAMLGQNTALGTMALNGLLKGYLENESLDAEFKTQCNALNEKLNPPPVQEMKIAP